jgi:A/G-specific adenine glycosylase
MPSANAANRLMRHYLGNARALPWRVAPGGGRPEPYRVWLSEVMLQQTTVAAVTPRFERFIARWPSIEALAAAPDQDILSEWAGLGYYARARNLIACARDVAEKGFPETQAELRRLPGIGDYTSAAIAAIAFGEPAIAVDTNVRRVTARLFAFEAPSNEDVKRALVPMLPSEAPGDFTQALMDLGATICRSKAPACPACPLADDCAAFGSGEPERYPAAKVKAQRPRRYGVAHWIERDGKLWLTRRPPSGLLGGMPSLPGPDWSAQATGDAGVPLARIRHVFTHFMLELTVAKADSQPKDGWWHPLDRLEEAGLPTVYRKAAEAVLAARALDAAA